MRFHFDRDHRKPKGKVRRDNRSWDRPKGGEVAKAAAVAVVAKLCWRSRLRDANKPHAKYATKLAWYTA